MQIFLFILALTTFIFSQDLFISEYVEASSSSNSYLEIFNPTENPINLSNYYIEVTKVSNGTVKEWGDTLNYNSGPLSGTLNPGQILIVCRYQYTDLIEFGNEGFELEEILILYSNDFDDDDSGDNVIQKITGDEAVGLFNYYSGLIDAVGTPGDDPGTAWEVAGIEKATKNHTLVRKPSIFQGNINWESSSGSNIDNSEWWVYPYNTYYFGGYHYQNYNNVVYGCMDNNACNYLFEANTDFDLYSICEYDSCEDCLGVANGDALEDECGVCEGPGAIYECGCYDNPSEPYCNCDYQQFDCLGECGGDAYFDMCNVCDDDSTNDCIIDECGTWGGPGAIYECGCYCDYQNVDFIYYWNEGNEYTSGSRAYNDIWGHTSSDSLEYALIGSWDGTHIINITNEAPVEVGFIEGASSGWRDIKTYNNYMYIGTEGAQGIQVVDINNPNNPILINEWDLINSSHNIMEYNGYLYIIGASDDVNNDGNVSDLIVLDINTDSENPQYVDEWSGAYLHDVCMYGNILYGCGITNHTMYAIDITDPTNVSLITSWDGIPSAHACWVSEDGNIIFTASETSGGHIISWDISDLSNINLLDQWMPPNGEEWSAHNLFVKDELLYISYYVYGLQILDISDPSNLVRAGYFDTLDEAALNPGIFNGVWGTFPYFNSDKVIISDRDKGLYVLNLTNDLIGDLNSDGIINIIDIISLINMIIDNLEYDPLADLNNDSIINILDIIEIVNIIIEND